MKYIIVGYGNIGKKRHKALKEKCVATVDPFLEEATYKSYKEVSSDIFDVAVLSVPASLKIEILEYFLKKKKHVIVEKPLLFEDKQTIDKLSSIAKTNNVIWYTSYNHRFEPLIIKLKEFLENGEIGKLYFARLTYGFGTAKNVVNSWRNNLKYGVLEEVGCHLIDLATYLFPNNPTTYKYKINGAHNFETNVLDYCSFSNKNGHLQFLCSWEMWKNTFEIDAFGSKGSIHLNGLRKWGESKLIYRERVYPSGVPKETIFTSSGEDETWKKDIEFFEKMISPGKTSYKNDLYISQSIKSLFSSFKKTEDD